MFGGDGATLLLHVSDLRREGASIQVARIRVSPRAKLATIRGGGYAMAARQLKDQLKAV